MKKQLTFVILLTLVTLSSPQNWVNHAKFKNFDTYFVNLMQHLTYEIEEYGWWNLRLRDQNYNIDQLIYDRHFIGTVNYTNGFLVGIDYIEMSNTLQDFFQGIVTFTITGSMTTTMKFYNMQIGYDVRANFGALGEHRFTGIYNHGEVDFGIELTKNYNSSAITSSCRLTSLSAASGNFMQYLPHNDIAEVIQRHYTPSNAGNGITDWCSNVFSPLIMKLIGDDNLGFPEICFNC